MTQLSLFEATRPKIMPTTDYILVPVSGGKDSTATLLLALATGKEVCAVFNDTGWEHPLTYEYIDYLEDRLKITIFRTTKIKKSGKIISGIEDLIREQGRFPFGLGRFCTMYLKQYALRDFFKNGPYSPDLQWEFWFGMRADESGQRAKKYAGLDPADLFDMDDLFPNRYNKKLRKTIQVRLPIVDWTREEVFRFLEDNDVRYNPLYDEGTNDRVGCYPCLLAGKKAQAKMFATEVGQERLARIRKLEEELGIKYEMHDTDQGSCEVCKI